jgi:hypothetical protein
MSLSIAFVTSRKEPRFDWFLQSLAHQLLKSDDIQIIIVDFYAQVCDDWTQDDVDRRKSELKLLLYQLGLNSVAKWAAPMPTVWQGPHRLTKENWWAMSAARNTGLCYATKRWFLHLDDRCVLSPDFMAAVRENMIHENRATFGCYQKRHNMTVENGFIKNGGVIKAEDSRKEYAIKYWNGKTPMKCPGEWHYGCCGLIPTEWMLTINGWDMTCDGASAEDVIAGLMLQNNHYETYYDYRMAMIEDRTPELLCKPMIRRDKGVSPNDRSHAMLDMLKSRLYCKHPVNLRILRQNAIKGMPWPQPYGPAFDF